MKIEKLNDNQIRCTLTRTDLAERQIKLSELICGSEKAKSLFQDMMRQASSEFGFEAEDIPLMIEAVPTSSDSIVLIITKVDDPEELDSKFSKFGAAFHDINSKKHHALDKLEGAEDILDLVNKVKDAVTDTVKQASEKAKDTEKKFPRIRLFSFSNLDSVIQACQLIKTMYDGSNTLYKDSEEGIFILVLTQSLHSAAEFNKVCNMLSEYGSQEKSSSAVIAFLEEHCEVIVSGDAIQQLGNI